MTAILAPHFRTVIASDIHYDLVFMWQALQQGWEPPSSISKAEYERLRTAAPCAERAFAGFGGASWGGKWFGGYARGDGRNYADESRRSLLRDIQQMSNVRFVCTDYRALLPIANDVVYADPPYASTTEYKDPFNSDSFWTTMQSWTERGVHVFVSEYNAPAGWQTVWEMNRTRDMKADRKSAVKVTERLFVHESLISDLQLKLTV